MTLFAIGLARAAFDETLAYAKERIQGGKPLIEHYSMKIRIHRMFAQVEAIRAMSRAVWDLNSRIYPVCGEYAFAGKTFCSEAAREVIDEGVQIHGGNGLTKEYFIEKLWRDSRALTIEDGENIRPQPAGRPHPDGNLPENERQPSGVAATKRGAKRGQVSFFNLIHET